MLCLFDRAQPHAPRRCPWLLFVAALLVGPLSMLDPRPASAKGHHEEAEHHERHGRHEARHHEEDEDDEAEGEHHGRHVYHEEAEHHERHGRHKARHHEEKDDDDDEEHGRGTKAELHALREQVEDLQAAVRKLNDAIERLARRR